MLLLNKIRRWLRMRNSLPMKGRCPVLPGYVKADCRWLMGTWKPGGKVTLTVNVLDSFSGRPRLTKFKRLGWLKEWPDPPRVCSVCGGLMPADALRLLGEGWELEPTPKPTERYLQPPGWLDHLEAIRDSASDNREPNAFPDFNSPLPPLKLNTFYLTKEEALRINHMSRGHMERWQKLLSVDE